MYGVLEVQTNCIWIGNSGVRSINLFINNKASRDSEMRPLTPTNQIYNRQDPSKYGVPKHLSCFGDGVIRYSLQHGNGVYLDWKRRHWQVSYVLMDKGDYRAGDIQNNARLLRFPTAVPCMAWTSTGILTLPNHAQPAPPGVIKTNIHKKKTLLGWTSMNSKISYLTPLFHLEI